MKDMNKIEECKPSPYIEIKWEPREGYNYPQPRRYVEGKVDCWGSHRNIENDQWQKTRDIIMDESGFWENEDAKQEAFKIVYEFVKTKPGEITKMFPFEIFLMNNGFKMISFDCLTALKPGISLICDRIEGDKIYGLRGFLPKRIYTKDEKLVSLQFGINQYKFFFNLIDKNNNDFYGCYHISNSKEDFEKAISGKLKRLYYDDEELKPILPII